MQKSMQMLLQDLWRHTNPNRRKQFGLLLAIMLLASFSEIFSIGAIFPFLAILTSPDRIFEIPILKPLIHGFNITEGHQLLFPLTIIFGSAVLISGAMRLFLIWFSTRLSFAAGADISLDIYRRTLYQSYTVHCSRNSSEIISGISNKANSVIYGIITPSLTIISSVIIIIAIVLTLFLLNPFIAFAVFGGFGSIYFLIITTTRKRLLKNSKLIARESSNTIKCLQEGLGGIRDVLISGNQSLYCQGYGNADLLLRKAQGDNFFIGQGPRYFIEALGMLLITILAYMLSRENEGIEQVIPLLGALAIGAQRLLPVLQQAYSSWSTMQANQASFQDTIDLLDQPLPNYLNQTSHRIVPFNSKIELKNLSFRYGTEAPYVLKKINLCIPKGGRVGFIGRTGAGKSTLIDIIMGLLDPSEGVIKIDHKLINSENKLGWQMHIAHVAQNIFLADATIESNIAFGVANEKIDHNRVKKAAKQAQIAELVESWPNKYQTFVGERGIRLSGGQCQRIGIARALYKQADVIVFDEATSALDNETEHAVMEAIESLSKDLTILIIAHRLSTLKKCTQIVELSNGAIKKIGTYNQMMSLTK